MEFHDWYQSGRIKIYDGKCGTGVLFQVPQFFLSYYHSNNHVYLLTLWRRVLLEKLTGFAASQEIPPIFGTRRFLTVLTSALHISLSCANSIQSPQPPPTSWRSILYYPPIYVRVSPTVSFPQVSPPEPCAHLSPPPFTPHAQPILATYVHSYILLQTDSWHVSVHKFTHHETE